MSKHWIHIVAMAALLVDGNTALANDVYISQTGGGNGSSCSGPLAVSYFNTAGNWTSGSPSGTKIGPGTTVHLCGTFTAPAGSSGYLTFLGGGTSGSPITLLFESGAVIQAPYWGGGGAIYATKLNYITVNLGSNGVIKATDNGSAYANQQGGLLAKFDAVNNLLVECATSSSSCRLGPNYVDVGPIAISSVSGNGTSATITCASSCQFAKGSPVALNGTSNSAFNTSTILTVSGSSGSSMTVNSTVVGTATGGFAYDESSRSIDSAGLMVNDGQSVTIQNLNLEYAHWCVMYNYHPGMTDQNVLIQNNTIQYCDHGIVLAASNPNATLSNVAVHDNDISNGYVWDDSYLVRHNHHDAFHAWGQSGSSLTGLTVYNNYLHGNWGALLNSFLFFEDNGSNHYVFNNIINDQDTLPHLGCQYICLANQIDTGIFLTNNTLIGPGTAILLERGATGAQIYNNISENETSAIVLQETSISAADYNDYYNMTASYAAAWAFNTFWHWQGLGYDTHGTLDNPRLNSSYVPQAARVVNRGKNLYSICNGQPNPGLGALCYDKAGKPRPATGKWDIGAYNLSSGPVPAPATGQTATPH